MKNIIKAFFGVMVIALVLACFSACNLNDFFPTTPTECEHSGGNATCTESALCELCGESYGEPLGHTEEVLAGKDASCEEAGLTEGKKCSVCGETLVAREEIPAKGHTEVVDAAVDADCINGGLTEGKHCSVCDSVIVAQEPIPAKGHADEDGNYICDVCEAELCTEHSPAEAVRENEKAATCSAEGSYDSVVYCSVCGDEISRETNKIDMIAHTEETLAPKAPTCTETGLSEGKRCSACEKILVPQDEIPALGHTDEVIPAVEPKCLETGLTAGKKCSVCGEILLAQDTVGAKGHNAGEWQVVKAATCDTEGERIIACTVCQTTIDREVIPAGHNIVDGVCSACGFIPNVFAGKQFVPSSDAAANIYSASFGYSTLTDGIIHQEGKGRFSSKQNGGKVEATIDLGGIYELSEFKVHLYWDAGIEKLGSGFIIEVLFAGEWKTVVNCTTVEEMQAYWVDNPESVDKDWLVFDLDGVVAKQLKFTIPGQTSKAWTTLYELECSAKASSQVEPEPEEPVFIENVFAGKRFIPTADATASILGASWWKGSGYDGLTDGIKNADNAPGRFSTVMAASGMMDATIDLGGAYELRSLKFYTYDPAAGTGAGSLGASLLVQVYSNGEWIDVVTCADNAAIAKHLVVSSGTYNDYLEFDLGGIVAEKVRFYISASASSSGTTYEEIECNGYEK